MHTNEDRPTPLTDLGYETQDLQSRGIIVAAVYFFGFAIVSALLASAFLYWFGQSPIPTTPQRAFTKMQPPLGTPILQNNVNNTLDIADLRKHENEMLSTSGPGAEKGSYRIPISRAIDLTVQRGLPKPTPQSAEQSAATAPTPAQRAAHQNGPPAIPPAAPGVTR